MLLQNALNIKSEHCLSVKFGCCETSFHLCCHSDMQNYVDMDWTLAYSLWMALDPLMLLCPHYLKTTTRLEDHIF